MFPVSFLTYHSSLRANMKFKIWILRIHILLVDMMNSLMFWRYKEFVVRKETLFSQICVCLIIIRNNSNIWQIRNIWISFTRFNIWLNLLQNTSIFFVIVIEAHYRRIFQTINLSNKFLSPLLLIWVEYLDDPCSTL